MEIWTKPRNILKGIARLGLDGYNSHDSMGEYYFNDKDYENSLLHYQMALDNYPAASNAKTMIAEITALMK